MHKWVERASMATTLTAPAVQTAGRPEGTRPYSDPRSPSASASTRMN
jgi:hypothetical protein